MEGKAVADRKSSFGRSIPKGWWVAARLLLTVLPLIWIGRIFDAGEFLAVLRGVRFEVVGLALAALLGAVLVSAWRWGVLMRAYGASGSLPVRRLFRYNLVAMYFNMLPGAVAGEAVRAYRVRHLFAALSDSLAVAAADRVCGLLGLLVIGALAAFSPLAQWSGMIRHTFLAGWGVACVLGFGVFVLPVLVRNRTWLELDSSADSKGVKDLAVRLLVRLLRLLPPPPSGRRLAAAVSLGFVAQGLIVTELLLLLYATSSDLDPWAVLYLVPGLILLTAVPLTPAAIGQRELVFVALLGAAGVSSAAALTVSMGVLVLTVVVALLGGLVKAWEEVGSKQPLELE